MEPSGDLVQLTGVNYGWIPVFEAMARAVIADRQREQ